MSDTLFKDDALEWAERQADLLRLLAAGEGVNAAIDWPHVIEEVRDVGLSELRACQSLLQQAMVHLLKLCAGPASDAAAHWRDEAGAFLDDLPRRFTLSMRQRIELTELYDRALRRAKASSDDSGPARTVPTVCPFTLDQLLDGDVAALVAVLDRDTTR